MICLIAAETQILCFFMIFAISPSPVSNRGRGYHVDIPNCIMTGRSRESWKIKYVSAVITQIIKNVWFAWLPLKRKYFVFCDVHNLPAPALAVPRSPLGSLTGTIPCQSPNPTGAANRGQSPVLRMDHRGPGLGTRKWHRQRSTRAGAPVDPCL